MQRPVPKYYEEEEYLEDGRRAFGIEDDSFDDFDVSQDISCATDQSPVDVMGFPEPHSGTKERRERKSSTSKGGDTTLEKIRRRNRLPGKSRSLEGPAKESMLAFAHQNTTSLRSNMRRSQSHNASARTAQYRQTTTGGRAFSRQHEDDQVPAGRSSRGSRRNALHESFEEDQDFSEELEERPKRNIRRTSRKSKDADAQESSQDRLQKMKELSNAFKAVQILNKGSLKFDYLKK